MPDPVLLAQVIFPAERIIFLSLLARRPRNRNPGAGDVVEVLPYHPHRVRIAGSIQRANISSCISLVEISPGALLYGGGLSACLFDRMV